MWTGEQERTARITYIMLASHTPTVTTGYGDINPSNFNEQIWSGLLSIVGSFLFGVFIGELQLLLTEQRSAEMEFKHKLQMLHRFLKFYRIKEDLKADVVDHYHKLNDSGAFFDKDIILQELPLDLQDKVNAHTRRMTLQQLSMFADEPEITIGAVVEKLVPQQFMPGQTIMRAGEPGTCMWFIESGKCMYLD